MEGRFSPLAGKAITIRHGWLAELEKRDAGEKFEYELAAAKKAARMKAPVSQSSARGAGIPPLGAPQLVAEPPRKPASGKNHQIVGVVREAWIDVAEQLGWKRVKDAESMEVDVNISQKFEVTKGTSGGKKRKLADMLQCSLKTLSQFNTFMSNEKKKKKAPPVDTAAPTPVPQ